MPEDFSKDNGRNHHHNVVDALIAISLRQEQIIEQIATSVANGDREATFALAQRLVSQNENLR